MEPSQFTQLGVSATIVVILLYILRELWRDNREIRSQMRQDQSATLPALTATSAAGTALLEQTVRSATLAERERQEAREQLARALELSSRLQAMLDSERR